MSEPRVMLRLSLMMALVYAVQGAWWPLMAIHLKDLGITGPSRGWIFACQAIGTMVASLGLGRLVDRVWPIERVLALIFALGTFALGVFASGAIGAAPGIFGLFLGYWLVTAPCYGLTNAVAFRHLARPGAEFGRVRLWGTAGWMIVGWIVSLIMVWSGSIRGGAGAREAFWVATAASAVFAVYALTLPHSPPLVARRSEISTREALATLLGRPGMIAHLITGFGVCLTTPFVFQVMPTYLESRGLPRSMTSTVMTIGQWPEIAALAVLPWLIRRFGYKVTIGVGLASWFLRFASLALDPPLWMAVSGTLLHGVGIACVTIGGQVYVDQAAPPEFRATAQALNLSITSGLGALLGSLLAGMSAGRLSEEPSRVFVIPCLIQAGLIIFFGLAFHPRSPIGEREISSIRARLPREEARSVPTGLGILAMESADG